MFLCCIFYCIGKVGADSDPEFVTTNFHAYDSWPVPRLCFDRWMHGLG
jgi:hypothetical protein